MNYDYDIIIIGAGSGGLVVASGAAALGAKVALIESEKMGGDCLNSGCVPSKSFLKGAHLAHELRHSELFGIKNTISEIDIQRLMTRVKSVIASIEPHDSKERYESLGVTVYSSHGSFVDDHTISVGQAQITGKRIVIATGSKPFVPNIEGLSEIEFLTNRNIFDLIEQPKHLIVLGAGPIGLELGQGFAHLGSKVSIVDRGNGLFTKDEPEVGPIMEKVLSNDGVALHLNAMIERLEKLEHGISVTITKNAISETLYGDQLLVSLGRVPNTNALNLESVGIKVGNRGQVITNDRLQTNIPHIYACGDVTGPYQFTHTAGYQAGIIIRNALFGLRKRQDYSGIAWTTYTKPEVAHVGVLEAEAKANNTFKKSILIPLEEIDRAKAENDITGFLKLIINKKGQITGATLVGDKAGEMISIANLAIRQKLKPSVFLNLIFSYPTESEIFKFAALSDLKASVKPWQTGLLKKLFFSSHQ